MSNTTHPELNFTQLKPYRPRQFVPENADLTNVEEVKKLYQVLVENNVSSVDELKAWILNRCELEAAMDQTGSILYIRMTCATDDEQKAKDYQHFIEHVSPAVKPLDDALNKKYLQMAEALNFKDDRYFVYNRAIKTDIELFSEKNIPLETKVSLLSQEYQKICGAMTVEFKGSEQTMPQMGKFLLEPERSLREEAWRAMAKRRLRDRNKLDDVFDKLCSLRNEIARNAGFDSFCAYKFRALHRFDYTPDDCKQYHATIEHLVVPLWQKILSRRKEQMGLDALRPWDTSVDPLGREPLKPFNQVDELIGGVQKIFVELDQELGDEFTQMAGRGLLDLASRKGKAPGGYQSTLNEARKPFIFMNAVGVDGDVRTLLHESGHAFHALACAHDDLLDYRHAPMEFCEVASMSMELLADPYLSAFYSKEDEERSRVSHLEDIVYILMWVAIVDAFQHWIYENPNHSQADRKQAWLAIQERFKTDLVDWSGLEEERAFAWHRQLHIFEVPFYYIEYGIAQLGALGVWLNAQKNRAQALADYKKGLALGGSRVLPELFAAAGIRFDFSEETIKPLMEAVAREINL